MADWSNRACLIAGAGLGEVDGIQEERVESRTRLSCNERGTNTSDNGVTGSHVGGGFGSGWQTATR